MWPWIAHVDTPICRMCPSISTPSLTERGQERGTDLDLALVVGRHALCHPGRSSLPTRREISRLNTRHRQGSMRAISRRSAFGARPSTRRGGEHRVTTPIGGIRRRAHPGTMHSAVAQPTRRGQSRVDAMVRFRLHHYDLDAATCGAVECTHHESLADAQLAAADRRPPHPRTLVSGADGRRHADRWQRTPDSPWARATTPRGRLAPGGVVSHRPRSDRVGPITPLG